MRVVALVAISHLRLARTNRLGPRRAGRFRLYRSKAKDFARSAVWRICTSGDEPAGSISRLPIAPDGNA